VKVFFCGGISKGKEGKSTSATLGSLQHRWPHASSRAKQICIVFKIHTSFILDRNLRTVLFFVLGKFTIKSNYVPCGYSVRQRFYKLHVFIYLISFLVENFITLHSMNIVLGHTIKNT